MGRILLIGKNGQVGYELGWKPSETFDSGIRKTVEWYLAHQEWVRDVQSGEYLKWVEKNYNQRTAEKEAT